MQGYLLFSLVPVMAMNSFGPLNLAANLAVAILALMLLLRLARPALDSADCRAIVVFGRTGFFGLCAYLLALYEFAYARIKPEGLPSPAVQLFTLALYALPIAGLFLQRRREPLESNRVLVEKRELRLVTALFAVMLVAALVLSPLFTGSMRQIVLWVVLPNFVLWTVLGFLLLVISLVNSVREWNRSVAGQARIPALNPNHGPFES